MNAILDRLPVEQSKQILCCYLNATSKIQVGRIVNIPNWYFEKVIFPGESLLFDALPEAELEIYKNTDSDEIIVDKFKCDRLQVTC